MAINGFGGFNPYQQQVAPGGDSLAAAYASAAPAPMAGHGGGFGDCSNFSPELGCQGMGVGAPSNLSLALSINFGGQCEPEKQAAPARQKARRKPSHGGPLNVSAMNAIAAGRLPGHAQISIPQQLKNMGMGGHK